MFYLTLQVSFKFLTSFVKGVRMGSSGVPPPWLSGPVFMTDRYLPCRSNFASTIPETNRTPSYQNALRIIREVDFRSILCITVVVLYSDHSQEFSFFVITCEFEYSFIRDFRLH